MRNYIITLLFFFISLFSFSQNPDTTLARQYLDSTRFFLKSSQLEMAYDFAKKAVDLYEQIIGSQDTLTANANFELGNVMQQKRERDKALDYHHKALNTRLAILGSEHSDVAQSYFSLGRIYNSKGDYAEALRHHQKALDLRIQIFGNENLDVALSLYYIGWVYISTGEYDLAMETFENLIDIRINILGPDNPKLSNPYSSIGTIYHNKGEFRKALEYYQKALDNKLKHSKKENAGVAWLYNYIGQIYHNQSDFRKALEYLQKAMEIQRKNSGTENQIFSRSCFVLGMVYHDLGEYDKAIEFYQKSLAIDIKLKQPNLGGLYSNMGNTYAKKNDLKKALEYQQKALENWINVLGATHQYLGYPYNNIATIHQRQGAYDKALENYQKSLAIWENALGKSHHRLTISYNNLGEFYLETNDWDKALENFNKALDIRLQSQNENHPHLAIIYDNIGRTHAKIKDYDTAITFYKKGLKVRQNIFENSHPDVAQSYHVIGKEYFNKRDYHTAIENFELAFNSLELMKQDYTSESSEQFQLSQRFSLFEDAIQSTWEANLNSPNDFDLRQAFSYAEKSKNNLLNEAFQKSEAEFFAGIPDSLLEKEHNLSIDLAFYDKKRFNELEKGDSKNDSLVNEYNSKKFDLKQQYDFLVENFEENYPEYFKLKYGNDYTSVERVRKETLKPDQALLEYFVGDSNIFVFLLKVDDYQVYRLKKDFPLQTWVEEMRKGIYQYHIAGLNDEFAYLAYCDTFAVAANQLYNKLVTPFQKELPQKLIIVPDGALNYIPFEILLMELPEEPHQFKNHPYFLREHQISYAYSATFLEEVSRKKSKASKRFLAFAPTFEHNPQLIASLETMRNELGALEFSVPEVEAIQSLLGGDVFLNEAATEDNLVKLAEDYRIIHLATHGKANDKIGDYSYLAFTEIKDSIENELLYVRDLYNLKLNADLVVLSACETGLGELQRGEGVISLARGFTYAGAKSILTTLWSVSDEKTKDLMVAFYKNLKEGMAKDEALRKAKLDYLDNQSHLGAHPFFWAGLIPIGDMEPIQLGISNMGMVKYGFLSLALVLIMFWFYKKRRLL